MQEAVAYQAWIPGPAIEPPTPESKLANDESPCERVRNLASENAVLVLGTRGCCMCHVVNHLLRALGVNPLVHELDDGEEMPGVYGDQSLQFPAVFIGGRLVGGLDWLMSAHISGELVPLLKKAGALWL